jgi:hypothetical protein
MTRAMKMTLLLAASLPVAAVAADIGPSTGDREFSIAGTGSNDRKFDSGSFGVVADLGWYLQPNMVWGVRQSVNYASIKGESLKDDFWNGSTRGYLNYHFGSHSARPFVGGSLGFIYGDGVKNSAFSGLEGGMKYYVLPSTYILTRVEYQWFFNRSSDADVAFKDGAFAHTVGIGYNY